VVAGTYKGWVLLMQNENGVFSLAASWQEKDGTIHWVAMAANGSGFVVGSSSARAIYFNTPLPNNPLQPAWTTYLTGCTRCGCVAISADGSFISAVGNADSTGNEADKDTGKVFLFENQGASARKVWSRPTRHSPNSTSMDAAGQFVTVADGFPDGKRGSYYLYDRAGTLHWRFVTSNMNWPMLLSSTGHAIAAGSDNSDVYYFRTPRHETSGMMEE